MNCSFSQGRRSTTWTSTQVTPPTPLSRPGFDIFFLRSRPDPHLLLARLQYQVLRSQPVKRQARLQIPAGSLLGNLTPQGHPQREVDQLSPLRRVHLGRDGAPHPPPLRRQHLQVLHEQSDARAAPGPNQPGPVRAGGQHIRIVRQGWEHQAVGRGHQQRHKHHREGSHGVRGLAWFPSPADASETTSVQFSKNQKYLLTGGKDGVVRIWELSTGEISLALTPPTGRQLRHIVTGPQWVSGTLSWRPPEP